MSVELVDDSGVCIGVVVRCNDWVCVVEEKRWIRELQFGSFYTGTADTAGCNHVFLCEE
jgi:hypothetical protein